MDDEARVRVVHGAQHLQEQLDAFAHREPALLAIGEERLTLAFAGAQAKRSGLQTRPARMSVELHPPVTVDKGSVLVSLATGYDVAAFVGDDAGDLAAFDALDALAAEGLDVARIAARSPESPADLLRRADAVVDGPAGTLALLRSLLD